MIFLSQFQEQKAIASGWARAKVKVGENSPDYVIEAVSADDEGRYFCKVINSLGHKEVYVDVQMLSECHIK